MVLLSFLSLDCVVSLVQSTTLEYTFKIGKVWRGTGGGSPGEQEAGGVRETGEERAGGGISTMAGSGREIQKGSQRNEPNNVS